MLAYKDDFNELNQFMKTADLEKGFASKNRSDWVNEFIQLFIYNISINDVESAVDIFDQYEKRIQSREFDVLPPIVFSDEFVDEIHQLLNPNFIDSLLMPALTTFMSFYIFDLKIDLLPVRMIFDDIRNMFEQVDDETQDLMLNIVGHAANHSNETARYIIDLFPIEMIKSFYLNHHYFSSPISKLIYEFTFCQLSTSEVFNLLFISVSICRNSVINPSDNRQTKKNHINESNQRIKSNQANLKFFKQNISSEQINIFPNQTILSQCGEPQNFFHQKDDDEDEDEKLETEKIIRIIDTTEFNNSLRAIINLIYKYPDSTNYLCDENTQFDLFLDKLLEYHGNSNPIILEAIYKLYRNIRHLAENFKIPKISYSTIISYINPDIDMQHNSDVILNAERILKYQIIFNKRNLNMYKYFKNKMILDRLLKIILNAPYSLKLNTLSTLAKVLQFSPIFLINHAAKINMGILLIDEIDRENTGLTNKVISCLNSLFSQMIKYGFKTKEMVDYLKENDEVHNIEDPDILNELEEIYDHLSH
ncbi:hypothetical protein TRFO_15492 [Tritrichomonas foetus]|uniref:Uncharacterized protein n=1 Tax=Tritrichomonas foetus TaxID=1144522 RepID=A0A1J4KSC9_9EUKA|nr:hypothetical protein TRFO_15492 [Tritrichomonas foetus]|eukprot:OHT14201.1 hypothetical protein TRFO_15492 [Tritrichomonas foetus]